MIATVGNGVGSRIALVLLRHGQSVANEQDRFGGWLDDPLTEKGRSEAAGAARALGRWHAVPDVVHTSRLVRATETAAIVVSTLRLTDTPIRRSWRLNERNYGTLQGQRRDEVRTTYGADTVETWRRTYDGRPPGGESITDVAARLTPWWRHRVVPDLQAGSRCLIVSHGNTLRALICFVERLDPDRVGTIEVPTGVPRYYSLDPRTCAVAGAAVRLRS